MGLATEVVPGFPPPFFSAFFAFGVPDVHQVVAKMILQMSKAQKAAATDVTKQTLASDDLWGQGRAKARYNLEEVGGTKSEKKDGNSDVLRSLSRVQEHAMELQRMSEMNIWEQRFNLAIGVIIVINIALIAVEMDWGPGSDASPKDRMGWIIIDSIFILIFIVEVCVRLNWERYRWPKSLWNWLDIMIIVTAMVDVWVLSFVSGKEGLHMFVILRVVRLIRLIRMVKLVRALEGLYRMVMAFWSALKSMSFVCSMMVFGLLLFSIFSVTVIGRNSAFDGVLIYEDTVYDRWGTVYRSMYSLFELMTLEGWDRIARPLVERQPLILLFLCVFIMVFTFGILNMVVALVVEKTLEQTRQMGELSKRRKMLAIAKELMQLVSVFREADGDNSGTLTAEELERVIQTSRESLESMGLPVDDAQELFGILDCDNSGSITVEEFLDGIAKIQSNQLSSWDAVATLSGVKKLDHDMSVLERHLKQIDCILEDRDQLLQEGLSIVQALQGASDSPYGKGR